MTAGPKPFGAPLLAAMLVLSGVTALAALSSPVGGQVVGCAPSCPNLRITAFQVNGPAVGKWFVSTTGMVSTTLTIENDGAGAIPRFYIGVYNTVSGKAWQTGGKANCAMTTQGLQGGASAQFSYSFSMAGYSSSTLPKADVTLVVNPGSQQWCDASYTYYPELSNSAATQGQNATSTEVKTMAFAYGLVPHLHFKTSGLPAPVTYSGGGSTVGWLANSMYWCVASQTNQVPNSTAGSAPCAGPTANNWQTEYTATPTPPSSYFGAFLVDDGTYPSVTNQTGTWLDYPGTTTPITIPINVQVKRVENGATYNISNYSAQKLGLVTSCGTRVTTLCTNFPLVWQAGNFAVTMTVDPKQTLPDSSFSDGTRTLSRTVVVNSTQLSASIDFSPTAANYTATKDTSLGRLVEVPSVGTISFRLKITNEGPLDVPLAGSNIHWIVGLDFPNSASSWMNVSSGFINPGTGTGQPATLKKGESVYLCSPSGNWNGATDTTTSLAQGGCPSSTESTIFTLNLSTPVNSNGVGPVGSGIKTLEFAIDVNGSSTGSKSQPSPPWKNQGPYANMCGFQDPSCLSINEDKGFATASFDVPETTAPTIHAAVWRYLQNSLTSNFYGSFQQISTSIVPSINKGMPIQWLVNITDSDPSVVHIPSTVTLELDQFNTGTQRFQLYNTTNFGPGLLDQADSTQNFALNMSVNQTGKWAFIVHINDASSPTPPVPSATQQFTVAPWLIQTAPVPNTLCTQAACRYDSIWVNKAPTIDQVPVGATQDIETWKVRILPNETGVFDQPVNAKGCNFPLEPTKRITIIEPNGTKLENNTEMTSNLVCTQSTLTNTFTANGGLYNYTLSNEQLPIDYGLWRVIISIIDYSNQTRLIYQNFTMTDPAATFLGWTNPPTAAIDAGNVVLLNWSVQDNSQINASTLVITHLNDTGQPDLVEPPVAVTGGCALQSGNYTCTWTDPLSTGLGPSSLFPLDGRYRINMSFKENDGAKMWCWQDAQCGLLNVTVVDTQAPQLISVITSAAGSGVQASALTGRPVTWTVRATDDTRFSAYLYIDQVGGAVLSPGLGFPMNHTADYLNWNYSYTFNSDGNYEWRIVLKDSGNRTTSGTLHALNISKNLAPFFTVIQPGPLLNVAPGNATSRGSYWVGLNQKQLPSTELSVFNYDGIQWQKTKVYEGTIGEKQTDITNTCTMYVKNSSTCWIRPDPSSPVPGDGYLITYNWSGSTNQSLDVQSHGGIVLSVFAVDNETTAPKTAWGNVTLVVPSSNALSTIYPPKMTTTSALWPAYYRSRSTDQLYNVSAGTIFALQASDSSGPGVASIQYYIEAASGRQYSQCQSNQEIIGSTGCGPIANGSAGFTLEHLTTGQYWLWYWATDQVGDTSPYSKLPIFLDMQPPTFPTIQTVDYELTDQWANFTILDQGSGVANATFFYKINNDSLWHSGPMVYNASQEGGRWDFHFPPFSKGTVVKFYILAFDHLGNQDSLHTADDPSSFTVGNQAPFLTVLAPTSQQTVHGLVDFRWNAGDLDGDHVTVSIVYHLKTDNQGYHIILDNSTETNGSYEFDTTSLPFDGTYEFLVVASDGQLINGNTPVSVILNVQNNGAAAIAPSIPSATVGQEVLLKLDVHRPATDVIMVFAIVFQGDRPIENVTLNDKGVNGDLVGGDNTWSALYTPPSPGDYVAQYHVVYHEGSAIQYSSTDTPFSVQSTASYVVSSNPVLVAAIVLAAVGAVGVGAWGALRRR